MAGNRFFSWLRGLDVPRQPGWIGGVCAGIASRLGIDPLIVRGIAVVVAVLGGPALLLYAAAWLLLPDHHNRIHLEEVFRGKLDTPIVGIGVLLLLSMLPVTQGFWGAGADFWGTPSWGGSLGRALWTLAVLALIVWFIVWMARRSGSVAVNTPSGTPAAGRGAAQPGTYGTSTYVAPDGTMPFATPAPGDTRQTATAPYPTDNLRSSSTVDTIPMPRAGAVGAGSFVAASTASTASTASAASTASTAPTAPTAPAPGAPAEELAAWREQRALWEAQHNAFRSQQDADRQARARAAQEQARVDRAIRRQAELELRARTRSHPLYSFVVIGLALIAGGLVSLLTNAGAFDLPAIVAGLAAALGVLAVGIIINGVIGKRPGGASGVAIVTLIALGFCAIIPTGPHFQYGGTAYFTPVDRPGTATDSYVTAFGDATVDLADFYDESTPVNPQWTSDPVATVTGVGNVTVILPDDEYVHVNAELGDGGIATRSGGEDSGSVAQNQGEGFTGDYAPAGAAPWDGTERRLTVTVLVGSGSITIIEPTEGAR